MAKRRFVIGLAAVAVAVVIGTLAIKWRPVDTSKWAARFSETPAEILVKRGREGVAAAIERDKGMIKQAPDYLAAYNDLGRAYLVLGQTTDAERVFRDALGRLGKSEKTSPKEIKEAVQARTGLAGVLAARGDFPGAQSLLEDAVNLDPRDAEAHSDLATTLFVEGKFDGAGRHYELASVLSPENVEILCNWGTMLFQANRLTEAEGQFRKAIALKKDVAKYPHWLGRVLRKEGRLGPAIKAEEDALRVDPKMIEALLETASIYEQVKQYRQAEAYYRAALSVNRDNLEATVRLACVMRDTDDPEQRNLLDATLLFQHATELTHEKDVNLLTQLADLYAMGEYYDRATETLDKAMAQAREQHLSSLDQELLLARAQEYFFQEHRTEPGNGGGSPLSIVGGEAFLPPVESANPYDLPKTESSKLPEARVFPPSSP